MICMGEIKMHDLSVFRYSEKPIMEKEDVLAGLDF